MSNINVGGGVGRPFNHLRLYTGLANQHHLSMPGLYIASFFFSYYNEAKYVIQEARGRNANIIQSIITTTYDYSRAAIYLY